MPETTSAQAPSTTYDPANPTPYSPDAPKPIPLPELTPPPKRPPEELQQPAAPSVLPGGKGSAVASVAFGMDSLLKGFMRGREQAQEQKYAKAKKLSDGLQHAYESAAAKVEEMAKRGADKNSPEYKKAISEADSLWEILTQMRSNYIMGGDGEKKPKGKSGSKGGKGDAGQQEDPIALLSSKDPKEKLRGALLLSIKGGAPYKYRVAQYDTPEYKQYLETQRKDQALTTGAQNIEGEIQKKRMKLHELENLPTRNPEQEKQLEDLHADRELFPGAVRPPHYSTFSIPGESLAGKFDTFGNPIDPKRAYREVTRGDGSAPGYEPETAKPGAEGRPGSIQAFEEMWAKESGIDPKAIPSEQQQKLRQAWVASGQTATIRNGDVIWTDAQGNSWKVPMRTTTTHVSAGAPKAPPKPPMEGAQLETSTPAATPATHTSHGGTKPGVRDIPAPGDTSSAPPPPVAGAQFVGKHKLSAGEAKSQSVVADTYKKQKPLFDLLAAQEDYMKEIQADPGKATPRQDLSLVVAAVRAMNPGSVRLPAKELELEIKAGSWGDRARRFYENASTGLLPDDQRKDLFTIIKRETTKAGESIAADWGTAMQGQPLPEDLKRFSKSPAASSASGSNAPHAVDAILDDIFKPQPSTAPKQ